jgi:hypothetical protein
MTIATREMIAGLISKDLIMKTVGSFFAKAAVRWRSIDSTVGQACWGQHAPPISSYYARLGY